MMYNQANLVSSCQSKFHTKSVVTPENISGFLWGMKNRVKEIRKSLGLTQEEFGRILGITYIQVGRLERGERQLREQTMQKYASKLNEAGYQIFPGDFIIDPDANQPGDKEKQLLENFRQMSERDQAVYLASAKAFLAGGSDNSNGKPVTEKKRNKR